MKIVYFGKPYSFTHVAALRRFKPTSAYKFLPKSTISKTIEAPMLAKDVFAVVPIENTTGGIIYDTVDNMVADKYLRSGLTICEEIELSVKLFIASKNKINLNQIKKIYSHEYVLKRTADWIKNNISQKVKMIITVSTSDAVQRVKKENNSCAIASKEAINHYGLHMLNEINIEGKRNLTRFFIITRNGNKKKLPI